MPGLLIGTADGLRDPATGEKALTGRAVTALTPDWAITGTTVVWRRSDGGDWSEVAAVEALDATSLAVGRDLVLVGTSEAHLLRWDGVALEPVKSFDEADERDRWYTPWGGPAAVRSIALDGEGGVFVNVHVGGVVRSLDRGETWQPTIDIDADVHQVVAPAPGLLLAACGDGGLAVSRDRGDNWSFHTEGLHGSYCRAVALAGRSVLLTASDGPYTKRAAVYRVSLDEPGPFHAVSDWFDTNIDTGMLAAQGPSAAFGTPDGRLYLSEDEGATWNEPPGMFPSVRAVVFS
jgi:hypothetical protein